MINQDLAWETMMVQYIQINNVIQHINTMKDKKTYDHLYRHGKKKSDKIQHTFIMKTLNTWVWKENTSTQ